MYKITTIEVVGELKKTTIIETDDRELVKSILEIKEVSGVDLDTPNRNIDPKWQELMDWYLKRKEQVVPVNPVNPLSPTPHVPFPTRPHQTSPWTTIDIPVSPFVVTC